MPPGVDLEVVAQPVEFVHRPSQSTINVDARVTGSRPEAYRSGWLPVGRVGRIVRRSS